MGREIKRVAADFQWPMSKTWPGYLRQVDCACGHDPECGDCYGDGWWYPREEPPEGDWWQVWETVSEGSPVSPAFSTADALIAYLVEHGDHWCQKRNERAARDPRWPGEATPTLEQARAFVLGTGWAPSALMSGGELTTGIAAAKVLQDD